MAQEGMTFKGDIKAFDKFLSPNVINGNLEREIRKATIRASLYLIKRVKDEIRGGFSENASMTLNFKRSNKPLIDQRNLWNAIDHKLKNSFESEVGVLTKSASTGSKFGQTKKSIGMQKVVELMEEGYTITVTDKMRKALIASLNSDRTKSGKLKKRSRVALERAKSAFAGGGTWVVPPRPLLSKVFDDPNVHSVIQYYWRKALEETFRSSGAKNGEHKDR